MSNLKEVLDVFKKWLYVDDTGFIEATLAVSITRLTEGTKLWLILVGPSGDGKTELLTTFDDDGKNTKIMRKITQNTLVHGINPLTGGKKTPPPLDLAPQLKNKIIIIPDMAQILKLDPKEKAQVWAQLRDLYDGCAGRQAGTGKNVDYKNLNITLIAASTPAIDSQILVHQDLGTRELIYRTGQNTDIKKIQQKAWDNEEKEKQMREELKTAVQIFLAKTEYKSINISKEIQEKIETISNFIRYMRASAEIDSFTGDLLNDVIPEQPTRIQKQLKRFYLALKSLDDDYGDDRALAVLWHIANSSANQNRIKVFDNLIENTEMTTKQLSKSMKIGWKTVKRELNVLWSLNIVERMEVNCESSDGKQKEIHRWKLNEKKFFEIIKLRKENLLDIKEVKL